MRRMQRVAVPALVMLLITTLPGMTLAQESVFDPAAFAIGFEPVVAGLSEPLFVTHAGDERLFVVERRGTIRIVQQGVVLDPPFLDITDRVGSDGSEQGLLGLAFPPDYADTGLAYVSYTDLNGDSVVSRFFVADDGAMAAPESEDVILTQDQPAWNHNGGMIAFGPDGYFYIGFGDGGGSGDPNENGQDPGTWLGKILRIDVDPARTGGEPYVVPGDNPFVGDPEYRPEIWASGLRNPWRYSFDRETGDLWIADVGESTHEEVSVVSAGDGGANLGWSIMEGPECFRVAACDQTGLTAPVFSYTHGSGGGCSVTGGYVYRGEAIPALAGGYVLADFCSGLVWGLGQDDSGAWVASDPLESGFQVSSFGEDAGGELYVVDFGGGAVYRIVPPA